MDDSFWSVMEPQIPWLHRQLRRLGAAAMDVEDLAQEVCLRVHDRWDARDASRPVRPWLYAFVFRVTSDYRRRAHRRHPHVPVHESDSVEHTNGESELVADARRALLLEALEVLSDEQRQVFLLVDLEEHAVTEAAAILEVPLNTAYTRLRRARLALRDEVVRLRLRGGAS
jgi:RNA polymerase sigma-70 factor (ECF subfamily)